MEGPIREERKQFMKPAFEDPIKKREEFSVSLRKKKQKEIIQQKRRRIDEEAMKSESQNSAENAEEK